jgi:hypothetical protein
MIHDFLTMLPHDINRVFPAGHSILRPFLGECQGNLDREFGQSLWGEIMLLVTKLFHSPETQGKYPEPIEKPRN